MMKRNFTGALLLTAAVGLAAATPKARAAEVTLEGTLVDTSCYFADPANTSNDHGAMKGCGTACAKSGLPVGLLTAAGKHYALVLAAPAVAEHVGQVIRVTGTDHGGSFVPKKLEVKKNTAWQEVKLTGVM